MATPLMPYAVPFEPVAGAYSMNIPAEFRTSSEPRKIDIPAGVVFVRFTWDGREGIRYRLDRADHTGNWIVVIDPVNSPHSRSSRIIEIAMSEPGMLAIQTMSIASQESVDANCRAGVTVIPTAGPMR